MEDGALEATTYEPEHQPAGPDVNELHDENEHVKGQGDEEAGEGRAGSLATVLVIGSITKEGEGAGRWVRGEANAQQACTAKFRFSDWPARWLKQFTHVHTPRAVCSAYRVTTPLYVPANPSMWTRRSFVAHLVA